MNETPRPPSGPGDSPDWVLDPSEWPYVTEPVPGHGTRDDRLWATLSHLSLFGLGIAFPLTMILWRGHRSAYVCHHAVEALNFHTTVLLAVLACSLISVLLGPLPLPVVLVGAGALAVRAARRASRGAWHRYPLTLRFVS